MKKILFITGTVFLIVINSVFAQAQKLSSKDIVDVSATLTGKQELTMEIKLDIKEGWHINSNKPFDDYLTPTSVELKDSSLFSAIKTTYPPPEIVKLEFSETELSLYENTAVIKMILKLAETASKKEMQIEGNVFYQPCNDQTCLFPTKKPFSVLFKPE